MLEFRERDHPLGLCPGHDEPIGQHHIAPYRHLPGEQTHSGQLVLQQQQRIGKHKASAFAHQRPFEQTLAGNQTPCSFQQIEHIQTFGMQQHLFDVNKTFHSVRQYKIGANIERQTVHPPAPAPALEGTHWRMRPDNAGMNIVPPPTNR